MLYLYFTHFIVILSIDVAYVHLLLFFNQAAVTNQAGIPGGAGAVAAATGRTFLAGLSELSQAARARTNRAAPAAGRREQDNTTQEGTAGASDNDNIPDLVDDDRYFLLFLSRYIYIYIYIRSERVRSIHSSHTHLLLPFSLTQISTHTYI